ncbi:MAG: DNA helicase mcm9, partial [Marteilia pararefringens]
AITFLDKSRSNETPIFEEHFNEFTDYWKLNQNSLIQARDAILAEVCPKIYGMYPLKLALMLQIIGGSQKRDEEAKIRGDIHMLLVGDPGTGKSQFLKFVHSICPNSVLTTGFGSTSAGLTAAASRDGGNWHLDAGALVLADKSICCIDEFSCIKESDKIQIHEAMEQQTISIAKAGMVNTLHTRCSILAATNPKGRYDPLSPLNINIALESPLISRFDVIMILLDNSNDKCDSGIADHIIGYHKQDLNKNNNFSTIISEEATWTPDLLKQYISCVKTLKPILSADAKDLLLKYYSFQRETDSSSNLRTTVRLLESLIRLSTAHAKLMFRDTVTLDDAVEAIFITEYSIRSCCIFSDRLLACQKDFPIDPDEEFEKRKETIISILLQDSENTEPVYHNKNNSLFSKIV